MNSQFKDVVRWILILPTSVLGSWLAYYVVAVGEAIGMSAAGADPNSTMGQVYMVGLSHMLMGAAWVYLGARIAPKNNELVAYALAAIGLVFCGFFLFPAVLSSEYWAIGGAICAAFGIGAAAYGVKLNDLDRAL
jgi:hypothetical protein